MKIIRKIISLCSAPAFSNVAQGTHAGQVTRTLEAAVGTRYLLGKQGTEANEIDICGAADVPLGVITDEGAIGDLVNVALPGSASSSVLMVASEAIAVGDAIYTAASGKVQNQPTSVGTYYQVGTALTAANADDDLFEVEPVSPRKTAVLSAFTGTAATDIGNLGFALESAPDKVIVLIP